jgi:hypothetical protein
MDCLCDGRTSEAGLLFAAQSAREACSASAIVLPDLRGEVRLSGLNPLRPEAIPVIADFVRSLLWLQIKARLVPFRFL